MIPYLFLEASLGVAARGRAAASASLAMSVCRHHTGLRAGRQARLASKGIRGHSQKISKAATPD